MDKDKIKKLCRQYEDNKLKVGPFTDELEKEGVPAWISYVICDLHRKVSYLTNYSKLDDEDRLIAAKWEQERETRGQLLRQLSEAEETFDKEKSKKILNELCKVSSECEHGRHIVKTCLACEHIEKTLFPDMFKEDLEEDD